MPAHLNKLMKTSLTTPRLLGLSFGLGLLCTAAPEAKAQSILYICSDQKGNAGLAFDHGMIDYIQTNYIGGSFEAAVSSEVQPGANNSTQGLYNPDDTNVALSYTFNNIDCVIISSTVSTHYVAQLMNDLNLSNTNVLTMSEETLVALHMVDNAASFTDPADSIFTGGSQQAITQNYYLGQSVLGYGDNYWNGAGQADVVAWKDAASNTADTNGFFFSYDEGDVVDSGADEFTMAGDRIFFGLGEGDNSADIDGSGVWTDTIDNNAVDDSENFDPNTHLTATGKVLLDQALGLHVVPEAGTTTLCLLTMLLVVGRRRRS